MSTTTLRLPDELRNRLARLAEAEGTSSHALMVQMLAESAQQREARAALEAEAERRWRKMVRSGEYLDPDDLRAHANALARDERPKPPAPRRLSKAEHTALKAAARRGVA
jgi:predicted transcriptional regulator